MSVILTGSESSAERIKKTIGSACPPEDGNGKTIELKMTTAIGLGSHLDDQPEAVSGGPLLNDFANPWPPDWRGR